MSQDHSKNEILLETGTNEVELAEFFLGTSSYGVNVAKIREFVPYDVKSVTRMPNSPPGMIGMLLLRGKTIPLINLKQNLELKDNSISERPVVLVTEFNSVVNGFLIDSISRIHRLSWSDIKPLNPILSQHAHRITGTVNVNKREILILDLEYIIGQLFPDRMASLNEYEKNKINTDGLSIQEIRNKYPVVIADDSGMIRKLIFNALKSEGYKKVRDFDNGLSAFNYLLDSKQKAEASNSPISDLVGVVVSDIEMPQMDGLNLCKRIKEDTILSKIPVIMFSSLINEQMIRKCKRVGADGHITKPEMRRMISCIDNVLGLKINDDDNDEN
jgi:two-component system chemotaxis response regulator CheV